MSNLLRRCVYTIHFVAASIVGGLFLPVVSAAALAIALVRGPKGHAAVFAARTYSRVMQRVLGWRIEAEGLELRGGRPPPAPRGGGHPVVAPVVAGRSSRPPRKKELERIPLFGWLWTATGNVLIDRSSVPAAMETIRVAAEAAKSVGVSVWVAPEGHRNMNTEMLRFKKGVFHLALAAQFPILPIAVSPLSAVIDAPLGAPRNGPAARSRARPDRGPRPRRPEDLMDASGPTSETR
ncbi:MAG: 1-acyl-sn-glycerol-3-phosphate acyltransferase [Holophagales bacterium]|nr:1-acyl-sn-glycerol-3-phosphate acyltransferase [Holophagales bacterium]